MEPHTAILTELHPRLVLRGADEALAFYEAVFGAEVIERFAGPDGHVVHAALRIGSSLLSLTEAPGEATPRAPRTGGAPTVLLHLTLPDPDAACARLVERGGEVVIPIEDRIYGKREGRVRDPFGHLWVLSRPEEDLSADEIRRRLASEERR